MIVDVPDDVKGFTPVLMSPGYGLMVVRLEMCFICGKPMVWCPSGRNTPFPYYFKVSYHAQLERAGWEEMSGVKVDDKEICNTCLDSGRASFLCYICEKRQGTDEVEYRFGDPPDFICKTCYATVPAKRWDRAVEEIELSHRYDHM